MATIAHVSGLTVEAVESDHESLTKYEEHKLESRADEEEDTGVSDMYVEAVSGAKLGIKAVFNANFEDHHDVYMVIKLDGRKAGSRSIERHEFHLPREHAVAQVYEDKNLKTYRGDFRFSGLEVCTCAQHELDRNPLTLRRRPVRR